MEDRLNTTDAPSSDAVTLPCWYDRVRLAALMTFSSVVLLFVWLSERQLESVRMLNLLVMAFMETKSLDAVPFCSRQYTLSRPIFGQDVLFSDIAEGWSFEFRPPVFVVFASMAARHCMTRSVPFLSDDGAPLSSTPRSLPSMLLTNAHPLRA